MTLMEMLVVIAIIGIVASVVSTSGPSEGNKKTDAKIAKQDFIGWFNRIRQDALSDSRPQRICQKGHRFILQYWNINMGWYDSEKFYLPPRGISIMNASTSEMCTPKLNTNEIPYIQKILFNESK